MSKIRRNHTLRHTFVVLACSLAVQAASAQTFSPWTQAQPQSAGAMMSSEAAPAMPSGITRSVVTGFAPWQDHTTLREMSTAAAPMGDASASVFRPWS